VLVPIGLTGYEYYNDVFVNCEEMGVVAMAVDSQWLGNEQNLESIRLMMNYLYFGGHSFVQRLMV